MLLITLHTCFVFVVCNFGISLEDDFVEGMNTLMNMAENSQKMLNRTDWAGHLPYREGLQLSELFSVENGRT